MTNMTPEWLVKALNALAVRVSALASARVDPSPTIAPPVHDCPSCAALRARVAELEQELQDSEGREG